MFLRLVGGALLGCYTFWRVSEGASSASEWGYSLFVGVLYGIMGLVLSDLISRFVSNLLPKTRVEVAELTGIDFQRVDPMYRSPLHYRFYIETESGEFQDRIVYPREIELYRGNDEHAVISVTKEVYRNPIFDRLVGPPYNKYRYKIFAPADFPFE